MKNNPLVSIIIPSFNRAGTILDSINSAKAQTYTKIEIIVVDDGSSDETREVLKNVENIKYIHKTNGGQASARNAGLQHANGEIISSLDSDDIWYPKFLEKCVNKLVADDLDFVFANWEQETPEGNTFTFLNKDFCLEPYFKNEKNGWVNLDHQELKDIYLSACPSPSSSLIIKNSSIGNGWNPKIKVADDWFMYLDVITSGTRKAAFTLEVLWKKRINNQNVYDGRERVELLEKLYMADFKITMADLKDRLSLPEMQPLVNKHVYALLELAKHKMLRERKLISSSKLAKQAFRIDSIRAFKSIHEIILFGLRSKMGLVKPNKNRPH